MTWFGRKWSVSARSCVALSVICAIGTFVLVRGYVGRVEALSPGTPVTVVVASRTVQTGQSIGPGTATIREIPSEFVPLGAIRALAQAEGKVAISEVSAGEILTVARVAPAAGPIAALLPSGMSAFPVLSGLPKGSVETGDHVDVIAVFGGENPHAEAVGPDLEVISVVGSSSGADPSSEVSGIGGPPGQTLFVLAAPWQTEELAAAASVGHLSVAVAGPGGSAAQASPPQVPPAASPPPAT